MQGGKAASSRADEGAWKRRPLERGSSEILEAGASPDSERLFPKLVPRRNASPKAVSAHQRARVHAAMIEACARHGYAETKARELAALAGVSTSSLYSHFTSKEECFLATYDLLVQQAMGRISTAYRGESSGTEPDWAEGLCRAFEAFADELIERPDPSRLVLVEVLAVAPAAMARIERAEALFTTMIAASLAQAAGGVAVSPKIIRPLVGGVWFVARARLLGADPAAIRAAGAELREWLLAYRSAAATLLPASRPGKASSEYEAVRPVGVGSERERMLQAAATVLARGGYAALSSGDVAEMARVDTNDFVAYFADVHQCFLATLEWLSARAIAEALQASNDASTWSGSIVRAVEVLFHRLATDSALARAVALDAFAAGPEGAERLETILRGVADLLVRRAPTAGRPSPLVAEAIVGSVWSIAHRLVAVGRKELLPAAATRAAFLTLAPIIGTDAALSAIVEERSSNSSCVDILN